MVCSIFTVIYILKVKKSGQLAWLVNSFIMYIRYKISDMQGILGTGP
mgnify:CR=1 FL=1